LHVLELRQRRSTVEATSSVHTAPLCFTAGQVPEFTPYAAVGTAEINVPDGQVRSRIESVDADSTHNDVSLVVLVVLVVES
jgi:hypothetical protein